MALLLDWVVGYGSQRKRRDWLPETLGTGLTLDEVLGLLVNERARPLIRCENPEAPPHSACVPSFSTGLE